MRRADLVRDYEITKKAIDFVLALIDQKISELKLKEINGESGKATIRGLKFCRNRIQEIGLDLEFNRITKEIGGITISDIDKLIHKNGKFKLGLELKSREENFYKYIPLNAAQYILLRDLSRMLNIPFYYLIGLPKGIFLKIKLNNSWKFIKHPKGDARGRYALAPVKEAEMLKESELKKWLHEVLWG